MSAIEFKINEYGYAVSNAQVAIVKSIATADKAVANSNGTYSVPCSVTIQGHGNKGVLSGLILKSHLDKYPENFQVGAKLLCNLRYRVNDPKQEIAIAVSPNPARELSVRTTADMWGATKVEEPQVTVVGAENDPF